MKLIKLDKAIRFFGYTFSLGNDDVAEYEFGFWFVALQWKKRVVV